MGEWVAGVVLLVMVTSVPLADLARRRGFTGFTIGGDSPHVALLRLVWRIERSRWRLVAVFALHLGMLAMCVGGGLLVAFGVRLPRPAPGISDQRPYYSSGVAVAAGLVLGLLCWFWFIANHLYERSKRPRGSG
ncbi:MAG: hypothetical protein U0Q22_13610 [Acidimicrobiales bacterium]